MSISINFMCSLPAEETRTRIANARQRYPDILKYFWISEVGEALPHELERAAEYNFTPNSGFLIHWNKEGGSEFIPEIPQIMYEVFGPDKILAFDLNYELIPPRN